MMNKLRDQLKTWFRKRHIKSFYLSIANPNFRQGVQSLVQLSGLGRLKPNIILLGFKQDWAANGVNGLKEINDYFGIIQDAFSSELAVCVLRNGHEGLDFSEVMQKYNFLSGFPKIEPINERSSGKGHFKIGGRKVSTILMNIVKFNHNSNTETSESPDCVDSSTSDNQSQSIDNESSGAQESFRQISKHYNQEQVEVLTSINKFQLKVKRGTIDIWWLYDDGGLSLLVPYLLTQGKSYLEVSFHLGRNTCTYLAFQPPSVYVIFTHDDNP